MPFSPKDQQTDNFAQLASLPGETLTEVVQTSLLERAGAADRAAGFEAIFRRMDALPDLDHRPADQIIAYDDDGLPS